MFEKCAPSRVYHEFVYSAGLRQFGLPLLGQIKKPLNTWLRQKFGLSRASTRRLLAISEM
jgi:hypothetical protein